MWSSTARNDGWLIFYHINLFCLLVCFVSLPGRDKDLNVFLMSRCTCLLKLEAQGWEGNQVGWPAENPVNMGQANAKEVGLAPLFVSQWLWKWKAESFLHLSARSVSRWHNGQHFNTAVYMRSNTQDRVTCLWMVWSLEFHCVGLPAASAECMTWCPHLSQGMVPGNC